MFFRQNILLQLLITTFAFIFEHDSRIRTPVNSRREAYVGFYRNMLKDAKVG